MDLPHIGAHCFLSSCHELDLLPIRCRCDKQFCKNHILPELHDCPVDPSQALKSSPTLEKLRRCASATCNRASLEAFVSNIDQDTGRVPALCSRCSLAYCVQHRDPVQHSCPFEEPKATSKNEAAHALLAKHFSATTSNPGAVSGPGRTKKLPTDPKKLAQLQKVEIMKMRHKALPGDPKDKPGSVPIDQRLHVKIRTADSDAGDKIFWFRKTLSTGRALDLLSTQLKVPSSDSAPIQLSRMDASESGGSSILLNDKTLSEQVEDGSSLLLAKVSLP